MGFPVRLGAPLGAAFAFSLLALAPAVPPSPSYQAELPASVHLHMAALPLGPLDGTIVGTAAFDASGTRAVFRARFEGATLAGDWRTLNFVQAFVVDAQRRTLTQLTLDGQARAVRWLGNDSVEVVDGDRHNRFAVAPPAGQPLPPVRVAPEREARAAGSVIVGEGGEGRFEVVRTAGGRYAILQIGARTLREHGVAGNGAYAIVGNFLVWCDRSRRPAAEIARLGPQAAVPATFPGSPYGDALQPILPLGRFVYQGAYRNGAVYFPLTYGMHRIVARSTNFVTFTFPAVPPDLAYSTGDGFGAGAGNQLYFAWPEGRQAVFWRGGRWVRQTWTFPDQTGNFAELAWQMERIAPGDPLWPPMRPDEDALDAALLQWRVYPIGDSVGDAWVASYLGRLMIGDGRGHFRYAGAPQYPFALLGRTDDGRIWGAAPQLRLFAQSVFTDATSTLWWSRDGVAWLEAQTLPGDAGAVGLDHRKVWIAMTHPWYGRAEIWLMREGDTSAAVTGGAYAGEQLFFASLPSGFYLVWGATPGWRLAGDQGPLCAYQIDEAALFTPLGPAGLGDNIFAQQALDPQSDPSLPAADFSVQDAPEFLQPTLAQLKTLPAAAHATLATNVAGIRVDPQRVTLMGLSQERAYEVKYAMRPYPLAIVDVHPAGETASVVRSFAWGPLRAQSSREVWRMTASGWQRTDTRRP
jgi:hypothetical protein